MPALPGFPQPQRFFCIPERPLDINCKLRYVYCDLQLAYFPGLSMKQLTHQVWRKTRFVGLDRSGSEYCEQHRASGGALLHQEQLV